MRISKELQIGKAGEYLVCADLVLKGFIAFPSEQGLSYDVLLDIGHKVLKVQVKTTSCPRVVPQRSKETVAYIFNIKRKGKNNIQKYQDGEIDLFALVCLDTRQIGYLVPKEMPDTLNIRVDKMRGSYYDEKGIKDYQKVISLKDSHSQTAIANHFGLHVAQVNRMLKEGYKPYESGARYFSDFEREREWFSSL